MFGGVAVGFQLPEPGVFRAEDGGDDAENARMDEEIGEGRVAKQGFTGDAIAPARLARPLAGVEVGLIELAANFR